jgi:serpin B
MKHYFIVLTCLLPFMVSASNPQGIVDGNNKFAFNLFHMVGGDTKSSNLIFSPFSISTAIAMTYAGARNETALQISTTMNFPQTEKFHSDYGKLLKELLGKKDSTIILHIANGLWAQKDFKFLDTYFDLVKINYRSELKNVDFIQPSERTAAIKDINSWVEQKTNDKIKDILGPADLTRFTRLVLVNAIYFYGKWAKPFDKQATLPKDFVLLDGTKNNVPFMNQQSRFNYYEDSNYQVIEIPYKEKEASMLIFLPIKKNGITEVEKLLDYKYYQDIITALQSTEVALSLPKFKMTFNIDLGSALSKMGMPQAFSTRDADFSGMTGNRDLYISKVIHQAFIAVNEKGTEAAAATVVVMTLGAMMNPPQPKIFNADHPFIFLIKDNPTGSILFMGKIMNPEFSN